MTVIRNQHEVNVNILIIFLIGSSLIFSSHAQPSHPIDSSIPIEKSLRLGVLENGFTYYIKPISEPQEKLNMEFIVKTGYYYEENNENNFAHLIEHLAFRESKNFPEGLAGNPKLRSDIKLHRADLGGRTTILHTSYYFMPQSANDEALETGLLWFKDIAKNLDLSEEAINRERGVILQESHLGSANENPLKVEKNLRNKLFSCSEDGNVNTEQDLLFPYHDVQQFYNKWYRPDLMAISIVGNIDDLDKLEKKIKNNFSKLSTPSLSAPLLRSPESKCKYFDQLPTFALVNHIDARDQLAYHFIFKDSINVEELKGFQKVKRKAIGQLITTVLNSRFQESLEEYGNTFHFNSSYDRGRFDNSIYVKIESDLNDEKETLKKAFFILNQLRAYGITPEELNRIKETKLKQLLSNEESGSNYWIKKLRNHFVYDERFPTDKISEEIEWIKNLTIGEVNKMIVQIISSTPTGIGVVAPENYQTDLTEEHNIRAYVKKNFERKTEIYTPRVKTPILMTDRDVSLLSLEPIYKLGEDLTGAQKYRLKNGVTVIFQPIETTSQVESVIRLHGFSSKGASSFSKDNFYQAMFAPVVVKHSGIGEMSKSELNDLYNSHNFTHHTFPYINAHESGFKAKIDSDKLETVFQLIYLYFTQPKWDETIFKDWRSALQQNSIGNSINDVLYMLDEITGDLTVIPYGSKQSSFIQNVEFDKTRNAYNEIFSNSRDFTFIITGDFESQNVVHLVQKYLGNLPSSTVPSQHSEFKWERLSGPIIRQSTPPESYQSRNSTFGFKFIRAGTSEDNWEEEIMIQALGTVFNTMLYGLRFDEGFSIYRAGTGGKYNRALDRYEITLILNTLPQEIDLVKKKIEQYLTDLKKGKISKGEMSAGLRDLKTIYNLENLEHPEAVSERLYRYHRYGEVLQSNSDILDFVNSITASHIAKTARKYFQEEFYYEVTMQEE